jgi:hypothetical protein
MQRIQASEGVWLWWVRPHATSQSTLWSLLVQLTPNQPGTAGSCTAGALPAGVQCKYRAWLHVQPLCLLVVYIAVHQLAIRFEQLGSRLRHTLLVLLSQQCVEMQFDLQTVTSQPRLSVARCTAMGGGKCR